MVLSQEVKEDNILINAVNPGWVKTDMGGENATSSVTEAAKGPVWLATLPNNSYTGCFFNGCTLVKWN